MHFGIIIYLFRHVAATWLSKDPTLTTFLCGGGLVLSCVCVHSSTGQLSGALREDWALPRPRDQPSPPTVVLGKLAVLVLLAPVPSGPAAHSADQLWICIYHRSVRGCLHCRLVSSIHRRGHLTLIRLEPPVHFNQLLFVQMLHKAADLTLPM